MFSGIVEEAARVHSFDKVNLPARLVIESKLDHSATKIGDSIAIEGICLTVVEIKGNLLSFDCVAETIRRSALATVEAGDSVNIERSIRMEDRLHGHLVFGHADAAIELIERTSDGNSDKLTWSIPAGYQKYIAPKGSVCISGVSLTVGEVTPKTFSVYIVPHTSECTTLSSKNPGDYANFEVDMLARYAINYLEQSGVTRTDKTSSISHDFLVEHGFAQAD